MMSAKNSKAELNNRPRPRPRTSKKSRYARARVEAGMTIRKLAAEGFAIMTVSRADDGHLPKNPHIRRAYLRAIGLEAE